MEKDIEIPEEAEERIINSFCNRVENQFPLTVENIERLNGSNQEYHAKFYVTGLFDQWGDLRRSLLEEEYLYNGDIYKTSIPLFRGTGQPETIDGQHVLSIRITIED